MPANEIDSSSPLWGRLLVAYVAGAMSHATGGAPQSVECDEDGLWTVVAHDGRTWRYTAGSDDDAMRFVRVGRGSHKPVTFDVPTLL